MAHRSLWPLAAVLALLATATACGPIHRLQPANEATPSPLPGAASCPLPTGLSQPGPFVWGADLVDGCTGWILIGQCTQPPTGQCQYSVARTEDGGLTWSPPVKAGSVFPATDGDALRSVHFLNRSDGFVYGHAVAFVTHDGGRTWKDSGLHSTEVVSIAGRGTMAWAVTNECAKGTVCPYKVRSSTDGGRNWTPVNPLPNAYSPRDAIPFGSRGLLLSSFGVGDMASTSDGGTTWTTVRGHCSPGTVQNYVASSDGREVWQMCTSSWTGDSSDKALFVTQDGGASWSQRASSAPGGTLASAGTLETLVSTTVGTAFLETDRTPVEVTHDGGQTWKAVTTSAGFTSISFASTSDAWALDTSRTIWATHDGGQLWAPLTIST